MDQKNVESYFHLRLPELKVQPLSRRSATSELSKLTEQFIYSQIDAGNILPREILQKYRTLLPVFEDIYRKKFYSDLTRPLK